MIPNHRLEFTTNRSQNPQGANVAENNDAFHIKSEHIASLVLNPEMSQKHVNNDHIKSLKRLDIYTKGDSSRISGYN